MSSAFVNQLRARGTIRLVPEGVGGSADGLVIRVEMPEVWDVVRIVVAPKESVLAVKISALEALFPEAELHQDFVLKFRGWEVLDEAASLSETGIVDGSILLLTHRRRRPVR
jgi:hypothetical protein